MIVKGKLEGVFAYGYFYGYKCTNEGNRYYKSNNVKFDDSYGITQECTSGEYNEAARKYVKMFKEQAVFHNKDL